MHGSALTSAIRNTGHADGDPDSIFGFTLRVEQQPERKPDHRYRPGDGGVAPNRRRERDRPRSLPSCAGPPHGGEIRAFGEKRVRRDSRARDLLRRVDEG